MLANHRRGEGRRNALADRLRGELAAAEPLARPADESPAAAVFRRLPERDRELISLVAWEGLGTEQIAIALGCSRNAVRIRLHRARRRFAKLLAAEPGSGVDPAITKSLLIGKGVVPHEDV